MKYKEEFLRRLDKNRIVRCGICDLCIRAWYVNKHYELHHPENSTQQPLFLEDIPKLNLDETEVVTDQKPETVVNLRKPDNEYSNCPQCKVRVRKDRLARHIIRVHRKPGSQRVNKRRKKTRRRLQKISVPFNPPRYIIDEFGVVQNYSFWIKEHKRGGLRSPMRTMRGTESHTAERKVTPSYKRISEVDDRPPKPSRIKSREFRKCPICGVDVLQRNLRKHKRKVHSKNHANKPKVSESK